MNNKINKINSRTNNFKTKTETKHKNSSENIRKENINLYLNALKQNKKKASIITSIIYIIFIC